jgi:hypothetical protein
MLDDDDEFEDVDEEDDDEDDIDDDVEFMIGWVEAVKLLISEECGLWS